MKKSFVFAVFASVLSLAALAEPSWAKWATLNTTAWSSDKSKGSAYNMYTAYYLTAASAETAFGGYDVETIESALQESFSTSVPSGGTALTDAYFYGEQYTLDSYVRSGFDSSDYVAVAFYGASAYRVFGLGSAELIDGRLIFDDNGTTAATETVGEWNTVVPEPTSGLLLILGVAGLALRRRRA